MAKEGRLHKVKYRFIAMITCHVLWSILHLVFDLTVNPHIVATTICGLGYYTGKLCKADRCLHILRQEIGSRRGLVRRKLTPRDYVEATATGIWMGLAVCGAVEVFDLTLDVRNRGAK